jgi:putative acyl-CoA dehydrogenase
MALDVLRALGRNSESLAAVMAEIEPALGADPRLDAAVKRLHAELAEREHLEVRARRVAGLLTLCLQGALLSRHAEPIVADTFCATRLEGDWTPVLGTLPPRSPVSALVERASVSVDG